MSPCRASGTWRRRRRALSEQTAAIRNATQALQAGRATDREWPLRAADDYLRGLGPALMAWAWARIALAAAPNTGDAWHDDKLRGARFGIDWLLPEARWRWQRVLARDAALPLSRPPARPRT
jgi:hypothetical protein